MHSRIVSVGWMTLHPFTLATSKRRMKEASSTLHRPTLEARP